MNKRQKDKSDRLEWIGNIILQSLNAKSPIEYGFLRAQIITKFFVSNELANSEIEAVMKVNGYALVNNKIEKHDDE